MVLLVTNVMETMLATVALTTPKLNAAVAMDTQPAIKWGWAILLPKVVALEMRRVPILAARLLLRKIVALGTTRAMQLGLTLLLGWAVALGTTPAMQLESVFM